MLVSILLQLLLVQLLLLQLLLLQLLLLQLFLLRLHAAWFISNFQKTVNRLVLAALMSYRPVAKKILYKSTVPERLEWVPGL